MECEHDKNHQAPQVPKSQTGCDFADFIVCAPIGPLESGRHARLAYPPRLTHSDFWPGVRAILRTSGSARAAVRGVAAFVSIIAARGLDHERPIASDRLATPRSLMQELIAALRQER